MLEELTGIIRNYTGDNSMAIDENTMLISDLGFNSFDLVSLASEVEDLFDIEIPDRAIKDIKTVGDVMRYIQV